MSEKVTKPKPVLLVMGLCSQTGRSSKPYRGYILDIAAEMADLWLFDLPGQDWQDSKIIGKTEFEIFDVQLSIRHAQQLASERDVLGVWSPDEATVVVAAQVADALGVPGPGVKAVESARDKGVTRELLSLAGLNQPRSTTVRSYEECLSVAQELGFPVVLKPRNMGASMGVVKVDLESELASAYETANGITYYGIEKLNEVIVEEYLEGPEVAIDGYFDGTDYFPFGVADKHLGYAPYFVEVGHDATGVRDTHADVVRELAAAHRALGFNRIVTHSEVRSTARGPVVIEINVRPGGDFIPLLIENATGLCSFRASIDAAMGNTPRTVATRDAASSVVFCHVPHDGYVLGVNSEAVTEAVVLALVDERTYMQLPPAAFVARCAAVISTSGDVDSARSLAESEASKVRVIME